MSEKLKGTNVSSPIVPFTTDDVYPTHYAKYGRGGYMSVQTLIELDRIPQARREFGMMVYCAEDDTFYQLNTENEWVPAKIGGLLPQNVGLQIYDEAKIEQLREQGVLPEEYISIPSDTLSSEQPQVDGTYLNIIFNALRSLQAEVAKIRNTFMYGMYSYVNNQTAMSAVLNGYSDLDDTEPLWAVQEDDCSLSNVAGATVLINDSHTLTPRENVESADGILEINQEGAYWFDGIGGFKDCPDTKIYLYLTTSNTNINVTLTNVEDDNDTFTIEFNNIRGIVKSLSEKYNVMICVSRAVVNDEDVGYVGKNYIWISVANYGTGETTNSGFWKENILYPDTTIIEKHEGLEHNRYYISSVRLWNEDLYKFNGYSQYQYFSDSVGTEVPDDTDYKYRVAHITIRSVTNLTMLNSIKNQLPTNELIYNEADGTLWIKLSNGNVRQISGKGSDTPSSGMEKEQIIQWLAENGIYVTDDGDENIRIANLADITFIHQGTGKAFKYAPDGEGNLTCTEIPSESMKERVHNATGFEETLDSADFNPRGFDGTLGNYESGKTIPFNNDLKLYADRVKIGAIYAPYSTSQKAFGCSHGYIELENTSDEDFQLDGCYLHFATGNCTEDQSGQDVVSVYSLPLEGCIPGGGTYLVRCKKYTDESQANTFIKISRFDKEWYDSKGNLLDLTLKNNNTFLLTYGLPEGFEIDKEEDSNSYKVSMVAITGDSDISRWGTGFNTTKFMWKFHPRYIDSVSIGNHVSYKTNAKWTLNGTNGMKCFSKGATGLTGVNGVTISETFDCIYKNTFELDPAKQAFQSLTGVDSSRMRNSNTQDYQYVLLTNDKIEFPKTIDTLPVEKYTPKASFEHKNVCTDKTKLDKEKPNMVTCSFGINIHTTRCFNWISCGVFDEYIWLRQKNAQDWAAKFESYKTGIENDDVGSSGIVKKKFGKFTSKTPTDHEERIQDVIYSRIIGTFPGDGTQYTSHKCIVTLPTPTPQEFTSKIEYEYVVGRADKNGNPDTEHISAIQTFTLYPTSYTPRIYQITDQQGFTWIEYQAWAAAAEKVNELITSDLEDNSLHIIPILVNTGDMTQNGTRINEWFDYYQAGRSLFNHLEQMNVVGNNDLCGWKPEILGTGDDEGKSNAFYFHVFYCYEIPEISLEELSEAPVGTTVSVSALPSVEEAVVGYTYYVEGEAKYYKCECNLPIITNKEATRYVPSLYYFENTKNQQSNVSSYRFIMVNSEITSVTCDKWYCQHKIIGSTTKTVNVYTGWTIDQKTDGVYDDSFTTVYTMIYDMMKSAQDSNQYIVAAMHEMPFTVVTNANLVDSTCNVDRSLNGSSNGALVGSHTNRLNSNDNCSIYWFSRLLEHFDVKLCIGGHKHTYACTNKLREFYFYNDNGTSKNSLEDGKMTMERTLEHDNTTSWNAYVESNGSRYIISNNQNSIQENDNRIEINTSKFPLMISANTGTNIFGSGVKIEPYYGVLQQDFGNGVTYFMCQATGYKLKSNKELPSSSQKFSYVIPETKVEDDVDKPSTEQLYPMFSTILFNNNNYTVYLRRIGNILTESKHEFSQLTYSTGSMYYKYLVGTQIDPNTDIYGSWETSETALIVV